jgi:hypothetical protein
LEEGEVKVIYIAGPYRDERGEYYVNRNIQRAREYALKVWTCGGVALCPLELVKRCDAIWIMDGSEKSEGTQQERELAESLGIRILTTYLEMRSYLRINKT